MLIEDLRLPCPHGMWNPHRMTHPRLEGCPGGRAPTRQELIDMLDGRPVVVMGGLSPAFYPADENDEADLFVVALGGGE